jgi:hypothetical protein
VEIKEKGEVGTVVYCGTYSTTDEPFYRVKLDGGEEKVFTYLTGRSPLVQSVGPAEWKQSIHAGWLYDPRSRT